MKKTLFYLFLWCLSPMLQAQSEAWQELPNPVETNAAAWAKIKKPQAGWGNTNIRYKKETPATNARPQKQMEITAWRGEKVSAQLIVWTPLPLESLSISVNELRNGPHAIPDSAIKTGFVRYVMTDGLNKDGKGTAGYRDKRDFDSTLVADIIDHLTDTLPVAARTTQPVWVSVKIPVETPPGLYSGTVTVKNAGLPLFDLRLRIRVQDRALPASPSFHLDLWQNPYAVARYHGVELFSEAHFEAMRPVMRRYADIGGKVITASITHKPWDGQTYDPFESMVTWLKKADGTWLFDYTAFDLWVEFMMSLGVTEQINCYSMIPWRMSFQYFDQASNSFKYLDTKPGDKAYKEFWSAMLRSFASHLKEKGWFDITRIAMDERPMDLTQEAIKVVKEAVPDFKISFAGNYHPELLHQIDDYCIPIGDEYPADSIRQRQSEGKITTYYTCCVESYPNTYTFSPPAEAEWIGWYVARKHLDGYLRWALNSWVESPLRDSRFRTWGAGDTYLLYPDGRSSVRFEKLAEGITAYEKINILRKEFEEKGDTRKLKRLNDILNTFVLPDEGPFPAKETVENARRALEQL